MFRLEHLAICSGWNTLTICSDWNIQPSVPAGTLEGLPLFGLDPLERASMFQLEHSSGFDQLENSLNVPTGTLDAFCTQINFQMAIRPCI